MNEQTLISIIIPSFNRREIIGETMSSVIAQSHRNWECIVIDDGSSDGTLEVIESFCKNDSRFRFFKRDRLPKGANTCRNIGLSKVQGDYFMFLDSDDLLATFCLENRVRAVKNSPQHDAWTFPSAFFRNSQILNKQFYYEDSIKHPDWAFLLRPQWAMNGSFFNTERFQRLNISFDEELPFWQDWAFHLDVLLLGLSVQRNGKNEPDVYIRVHNNPSRINNSRKIDPKKIDALYTCLFSLHNRLLHQKKFDSSYFVYRMYYLFEYLIYRGNRDLVSRGFHYLDEHKLNKLKVYNLANRMVKFTIKLPVWDKIIARMYFLANQKVLKTNLKSLKKI